ncbi:MAG TPA: maleylpyruvate isomerase N-terminal domain-containing protein [Mycobacteriales bacterium]|nr:maleylpyruvate isomerase N-terminal domain-containing protein [Mycobacteriales bacterium]
MTETVNTEGATPYAGVPLKLQDVRFAITPAEAVAAAHSQRGRLLETVRDLTADEWSAQSRCSLWTVQDVVRHLTDIGGVQADGMEAARAGERFSYFSTFDPKATPAALIAESGPEEVGVTLDAFVRSTERLLGLVDEVAAAGDDTLLVSTPAGRQPWHRSLLHGLFDSAVHERDIVEPLPARSAPFVGPGEVRAIASYQVLLVARILGVVGAPVDLGLELDGGPTLHVVVDGPVVSVQPLGDDAAPAARAKGEVSAVLDAMAGRGALADVLDGPPEVAMGLSALSSLV